MDVNVRKLKAILVLLVLILLVVSIITVFGKAMVNNVNQNDNTGHSSDVTFHISSYTKLSIMEDYTNPSPEDMQNAYDMFSYEDCRFVEEGLLVLANDWLGTTERFYTDIWPESRKHTSLVERPTFGEIDLIEDTETYMIIALMDVEKDDIKDYVKKLKETFTYGVKKNEKEGMLFSGSNGKNLKVTVDYNEKEYSAQIYYNFY